MTMPAPRIACIMPFLDESRWLPSVLASIEAQDIPRERLFFIAVDNGSSDGGDAMVADWLARIGMPGKLVRAAVQSIPFALNAGLAETSDDDIVVRLDAHTLYDPAYLGTIAQAFETLEPDVWCVGGAPTPAPPDDFSSALGEALYSNPMGLGPADFREVTSGRVSTVYLGAWRPGVLQRLGGYDERWLANEDCELAERIAEAGGTIMRIPVRCGRINARGPGATVRQWSRYGFWRAQTFKRYPTAIRPRHVLAPAALVFALALLVSPLRLALAPLYAAYALATIALRRQGESLLVTASTLGFFPLVHVGYSLGLIAGAVRSPAPLKSERHARALRP
jgi:glycosyltransferase involved in cell wall biosynthesis